VTHRGDGARWEIDTAAHCGEEATYLRLDCAKAGAGSGWTPLLDIEAMLRLTIDWYRAAHAGAGLRTLTIAQIEAANRGPGGRLRRDPRRSSGERPMTPDNLVIS
jgi:hypothetical protein